MIEKSEEGRVKRGPGAKHPASFATLTVNVMRRQMIRRSDFRLNRRLCRQTHSSLFSLPSFLFPLFSSLFSLHSSLSLPIESRDVRLSDGSDVRLRWALGASPVRFRRFAPIPSDF